MKNKMLGCLYGQAIGDALGIQSEFMSKEDVTRRYSPILRYYNQDCPNGMGSWNDDDTEQMLCILDEFVDSKTITAKGLGKRLVNWRETNGRGCGNLVGRVLSFDKYLNNPIYAAYSVWKSMDLNNPLRYVSEICYWEDRSDNAPAPNGALMRISVVGLWRSEMERNAIIACRVTHFDDRCVGSCVIAASIIHNLVWHNRELSYDEIKAIGNKYDRRIAEWVDLAYNSDDIANLDLDESSSIGYTLRTLSAALWCYWHSSSFEDGLLAVVNEGGDADTNAAIAGAILCAKFGYDSIPQYYIESLYNEEEFHNKVNKFISLALNEKG